MTESSVNPEALPNAPDNTISNETLTAAEQVVGLKFTTAEHELMRDGVGNKQKLYEKLRNVMLDRFAGMWGLHGHCVHL